MPVTELGGLSLIQLAFMRVVQFLMLLVFTSSGSLLCAQGVTIRLVNGRNGHPMADSHVNVGVGKNKRAAVIPTNKDGIAQLRLTNNDDEVDFHYRCETCGNFVAIDPVVKYDDSLRINVPYVLCQPGGPNYSWLAFRGFSTKQLIQQGIVTPNTCGKATASPKPGELIIFVRPLNFWEIMKQ